MKEVLKQAPKDSSVSTMKNDAETSEQLRTVSLAGPLCAALHWEASFYLDSSIALQKN